ncbi:MAG TPA: hypothetical protein V6C91_08565 [Coleofasciculaceae cyanobacterium]
MKLRSITPATIVSLLPISTTLAAIAFLAPTPATAQLLHQPQSQCIQRTMYDAFGNIKPGMTAEAAAFACQRASVHNSVGNCVQETLYDAFGNIKPGMSAEAAAFACRSGSSNYAVSDCVQQTMYDAFGNIRPGMNAQSAAFACSDPSNSPGYIIIVKPRY